MDFWKKEIFLTSRGGSLTFKVHCKERLCLQYKIYNSVMSNANSLNISFLFVNSGVVSTRFFLFLKHGPRPTFCIDEYDAEELSTSWCWTDQQYFYEARQKDANAQGKNAREKLIMCYVFPTIGVLC